jgi:hypothetical protein
MRLGVAPSAYFLARRRKRAALGEAGNVTVICHRRPL